MSNLADNTTEDTLRFYFENRKRSGGGDVADVTLDMAAGVAWVVFKETDGKT